MTENRKYKHITYSCGEIIKEDGTVIKTSDIPVDDPLYQVVIAREKALKDSMRQVKEDDA